MDCSYIILIFSLVYKSLSDKFFFNDELFHINHSLQHQKQLGIIAVF